MINSTSILHGNRTPIFIASIIEGFGTIVLNLVVLTVSYNIPIHQRNPLRIFYAFLGMSDLLNGAILFVSSFNFFLKDGDFFHYYYICVPVVVLAYTQLVTTGYILLWLTFVKCVSIIYPLRSLLYVTRNMAMRSSVGVWMLTYVVVIAPTICWVKDDVYLHDEECDVLVLFHDQAEKNIRLLGIILTVIFVVVLLTLNSLIVASVFKRNRGFTSRKTVIQNLRIDSNIFRGPSSEQNETQRESISYGNVKRTKPRENTAGKIRIYDFKKSKSFKAYLTVLMHVGFNFLCGLPVSICATNTHLLVYYINDRRVRYVCYMSMCLTSLINPILTLLRLPVFKTTLTKLFKKYSQRNSKYNY